MVLITVSVTTTVIDTLVDTDAEIQSALSDGNNITTIQSVAILPISNTKAKAVMVWT